MFSNKICSKIYIKYSDQDHYKDVLKNLALYNYSKSDGAKAFLRRDIANRAVFLKNWDDIQSYYLRDDYDAADDDASVQFEYSVPNVVDVDSFSPPTVDSILNEELERCEVGIVEVFVVELLRKNPGAIVENDRAEVDRKYDTCCYELVTPRECSSEVTEVSIETVVLSKMSKWLYDGVHGCSHMGEKGICGKCMHVYAIKCSNRALPCNPLTIHKILWRELPARMKFEGGQHFYKSDECDINVSEILNSSQYAHLIAKVLSECRVYLSLKCDSNEARAMNHFLFKNHACVKHGQFLIKWSKAKGLEKYKETEFYKFAYDVCNRNVGRYIRSSSYNSDPVSTVYRLFEMCHCDARSYVGKMSMQIQVINPLYVLTLGSCGFSKIGERHLNYRNLKDSQYNEQLNYKYVDDQFQVDFYSCENRSKAIHSHFEKVCGHKAWLYDFYKNCSMFDYPHGWKVLAEREQRVRTLVVDVNDVRFGTENEWIRLFNFISATRAVDLYIIIPVCNFTLMMLMSLIVSDDIGPIPYTCFMYETVCVGTSDCYIFCLSKSKSKLDSSLLHESGPGSYIKLMAKFQMMAEWRLINNKMIIFSAASAKYAKKKIATNNYDVSYMFES